MNRRHTFNDTDQLCSLRRQQVKIGRRFEDRPLAVGGRQPAQAFGYITGQMCSGSGLSGRIGTVDAVHGHQVFEVRKR